MQRTGPHRRLFAAWPAGPAPNSSTLIWRTRRQLGLHWQPVSTRSADVPDATARPGLTKRRAGLSSLSLGRLSVRPARLTARMRALKVQNSEATREGTIRSAASPFSDETEPGRAAGRRQPGGRFGFRLEGDSGELRWGDIWPAPQFSPPTPGLARPPPDTTRDTLAFRARTAAARRCAKRCAIGGRRASPGRWPPCSALLGRRHQLARSLLCAQKHAFRRSRAADPGAFRELEVRSPAGSRTTRHRRVVGNRAAGIEIGGSGQLLPPRG